LTRSGRSFPATSQTGLAHANLTHVPGGLKVCDANGQSLAYVYSRENPNDAHMAKVLTEDEARRIASNIAKLPNLLGKGSSPGDRRCNVIAVANACAREPVTLKIIFAAGADGFDRAFMIEKREGVSAFTSAALARGVEADKRKARREGFSTAEIEAAEKIKGDDPKLADVPISKIAYICRKAESHRGR
jgi:hypothetical protein